MTDKLNQNKEEDLQRKSTEAEHTDKHGTNTSAIAAHMEGCYTDGEETGNSKQNEGRRPGRRGADWLTSDR